MRRDLRRDIGRGRPPEGIRCFWAIELPEETRSALEAFCRAARARGIRAGWPAPTSYHLTLCFMGRAAPEAVDMMIRRVETDLAETESRVLELAVRGMGAFPDVTRPAVCWAGIEVLAGDLAGIRARVYEAAREAGCGPDGKAFHPHVTLARSRSSGESGALAAWLREAGCPAFGSPFRAERLVLFHSELRPEGARHTPRAVVPLG